MTRVEPDLTQPKHAEKSLGDLFGDLSREFAELVRTQTELAKTEIGDQTAKAKIAAGAFGGAAVAGYMALVLLSFAAAWGLSEVMPEGVAFLIVGVVYGAVAGVLYLRGRRQVEKLNIVPEQTMESLKEDVQWAQQKTRSRRENELRYEARNQRDRMGDTLDAIGDRLSPERMVERRKAAVGQRFRSVKESIMGSPDYREPVTSRVRAEAGGAMQSASETAQSVGARMQHAPEALAEQTRGNPVAAGLVAFGAGVLLATAFPSSRTERRLVGEAQPQLQQAAEQLKGAGRDVAADARGHAQEALEDVKAAGVEAGTNVRGRAAESAENVRSEPRS